MFARTRHDGHDRPVSNALAGNERFGEGARLSAIFGILRFDEAPVAARDLERMSSALAHRGPDGRKFVAIGSVGLGHCLMRATEEDRIDAQPARARAAEVTLVADVRLDNREELARRFGMSSGELAATPDSGLVLRAYLEWGEEFPDHLLGDFAVAVWDERARRLTLARDHMGQRYVHYHCGREALVFATEVNALWTQVEVPRALSDTAIARRLVFSRDAPDGETMYDDIKGVPGGGVLSVEADGRAHIRRYWVPEANPAHQHRDEAYYVDAYRDVLGEAVACRVRRTLQSPGLLFSGGYDSAAVAGLAGPTLVQRGQRLIAASSVMPADYRGTIRHARRWVELCARDMPHLDVHYVTREGKSVLSDLERSFFETGGAAGSYHFVNRELLATISAAGARVVMDGNGGDYTLHPRGEAALARFAASGQLRRFLTELRGHVRMTRTSYLSTLRSVTSALALPAVLSAVSRFRQAVAPARYARPIAPAFARRMIANGTLNPQRLHPAARPSIDMRGEMLTMLRRVAGAGAPGPLAQQAAHRGLELTHPFHDKRVVELALGVPEELYVKHGRNRYLACTALRDVYPAEFWTRWRSNDDEIPDFQRMAKSIEPQLLAELDRMERSRELTRYCDFSIIRRLLAARGPDDHNSGWERETQLALHGFVAARHVEWFRRHNR